MESSGSVVLQKKIHMWVFLFPIRSHSGEPWRERGRENYMAYICKFKLFVFQTMAEKNANTLRVISCLIQIFIEYIICECLVFFLLVHGMRRYMCKLYFGFLLLLVLICSFIHYILLFGILLLVKCKLVSKIIASLYIFVKFICSYIDFIFIVFVFVFVLSQMLFSFVCLFIWFFGNVCCILFVLVYCCCRRSRNSTPEHDMVCTIHTYTHPLGNKRYFKNSAQFCCCCLKCDFQVNRNILIIC